MRGSGGKCYAAAIVAAGVFGTANLASAEDAALPVVIAATNRNVREVGRFDARDAVGPRCQWTASEVALRFRGAELNAKIGDTSGNDRLQIVVDGRPTRVLALEKDLHLYRIATGLSGGEHTVSLFKRTEAFVGIVQYQEFQLSAGGKLLPPKPAKRRIEVIGDSISCGYGDEGANQNEHFTPATENGYLTYGAIAARKFGADFLDIAWSGRKMWPDNTIPEIYDLALPFDKDSAWNFSRQVPDAVLINMATNDFGRENPDETGWTNAYKAFLARVRKNYPKAVIYCAIGSMMNDGYPPGHHALTTVRAYLTKLVAQENRGGDAKVRLLEFETQDGKNGIGSDYHPNVKTHEIMAEKFRAALEKDLGWKVIGR